MKGNCLAINTQELMQPLDLWWAKKIPGKQKEVEIRVVLCFQFTPTHQLLKSMRWPHMLLWTTVNNIYSRRILSPTAADNH